MKKIYLIVLILVAIINTNCSEKKFTSEYEPGTDGYLFDSIAWANPTWDSEKIDDNIFLSKQYFDLKYNIGKIKNIDNSMVSIFDLNGDLITTCSTDEFIRINSYINDEIFDPRYEIEIKNESLIFIRDVSTKEIYVTTLDSLKYKN